MAYRDGLIDKAFDALAVTSMALIGGFVGLNLSMGGVLPVLDGVALDEITAEVAAATGVGAAALGGLTAWTIGNERSVGEELVRSGIDARAAKTIARAAAQGR